MTIGGSGLIDNEERYRKWQQERRWFLAMQQAAHAPTALDSMLSRAKIDGLRSLLSSLFSMPIICNGTPGMKNLGTSMQSFDKVIDSMIEHGEADDAIDAIACLQDPLKGVWVRSAYDLQRIFYERAHAFSDEARPEEHLSPLTYFGHVGGDQDICHVRLAHPDQWLRLTAAVALGQAEWNRIPITRSYGHTH